MVTTGPNNKFQGARAGGLSGGTVKERVEGNLSWGISSVFRERRHGK